MSEALVFDTGPLSHFAEAQWLKILQALAGDRAVLIPRSSEGRSRRRPISIRFSGRYSTRIGSRRTAVTTSTSSSLRPATRGDWRRAGRTSGNCGVLALAEARGHIAVIDDRVARHVGEENGVHVKGALALMCEGIQQGMLTVPLVSRIADDLLATEYRLPVRPGQFASWAA